MSTGTVLVTGAGRGIASAWPARAGGGYGGVYGGVCADAAAKALAVVLVAPPGAQ